MKLVRARPKRVEDLPEWGKCCDEFISAFAHLPEMLLDLSTTWHDAEAYCAFCGYRRGLTAFAEDVADKLGVHLGLVEIDEGEYAGVTR